MSVTNGYISTDEAVRYTGKSAAGETADLDDVITSVSRLVDSYCGRHFYQSGTSEVPEARVFEADELRCLDLGPFNDLVSLSSLKVDRDGSGTYGETITSYVLGPANAAVFSWPYTEIELLAGVYFPTFSPTGREYLVQVNGVWGWPEIPAEVKQATKMAVAYYAKMQDAPLGVAGVDATGMGIRVGRELPGTVKALLDPFRHPMSFGIA